MHLVEEVWLVVTTEEMQLNRLVEEKVVWMMPKRINAQMSFEDKKNMLI